MTDFKDEPDMDPTDRTVAELAAYGAPPPAEDHLLEEDPTRLDHLENRDLQARTSLTSRDLVVGMADRLGLDAIHNPKMRAYLAGLAVSGVVGTACRVARVTRSAVFAWRRTCEPFPAAEAAAMEMAGDLLEEEARRRALVGELEPVYGSLGKDAGTGVVGYRRKKSDTLLMFMLNGRRSDVFKGRAALEVSGPGGGPVKTESLAAVLGARLDQVAAALPVGAGRTPAAEAQAALPPASPDVPPASEDGACHEESHEPGNE